MHQRKPIVRLFRVVFAVPAVLVSAVAVLYLVLLSWSMLLRVQWMSHRTRGFSARANRLAGKVAGTRLGSLYFNMSALHHVGRNSGRTYVTPLGVYPLGDGFVFALAYGPKVDWCRNVRAAGKCALAWRGQEYPLERPELIPRSDALKAYPVPVKAIIVAAGTKQFLWLHKQAEIPEKDTGSTQQIVE
jgi:deazaflavin-dependent oxidoreductase (nitroreductase family)